MRRQLRMLLVVALPRLVPRPRLRLLAKLAPCSILPAWLVGIRSYALRGQISVAATLTLCCRIYIALVILLPCI